MTSFSPGETDAWSAVVSCSVHTQQSPKLGCKAKSCDSGSESRVASCSGTSEIRADVLIGEAGMVELALPSSLCSFETRFSGVRGVV